MNKTISSLALLKARYDESKSDVVDSFIPFLSYVIERNCKKEFTSHEVKIGIDQEFGFEIPIHSIEMILNRLKKSGSIKRKCKKNSIYTKELKLIDLKSFDVLKDDSLNHYDTLVKNFTDYVRNDLNREIEEKKSETFIENYMDEYVIECIDSYTNGSRVRVKKESAEIWRFLVSSYLYEISNNDPAQFAYFASVLKGRMIMNCIVARDLSALGKKFNNTDIYLDAPIILRVLGLHGKREEEYAHEAIDLYKECGAKINVFNHTLEEVDGILISAERNLSASRPGYGDVIKNLRDKGLEASDVALIRSRKESTLLELDISTKPTPSYIDKFQIDESSLEETMSYVGLTYRNEPAKRADINSIRSAYVIRGNDHPSRLEDCKAIFVTNNSSLSRAAFEFMKNNEGFQNVSPIITDFSLTNILWLKSSLRHSDIPEKILSANCFAALNPSEAVWNKFYREIEKLKKSEKISKQDHAFLRYDLKVAPELMNLTYGSDSNITEEAIFQILTNRESQIVKPYEDKILNYEKNIREKEEKINAQFDAIQGLRSKINKFGEIIGLTFKVSILAIFGVLFVVIYLDNKNIRILNEFQNNYFFLYNSMILIGLFLSFFSFVGHSNMNPVNYISNNLKKYIVKALEGFLISTPKEENTES